MRALVLMIGRPFHWGHIALSLEESGYETVLAEYKPNVFSAYAENGIFFDLIISTRHGMAHIHNEIYSRKWDNYGNFKFKAIIYQYDDAFSEIVTYRNITKSFKKNGFNITTYIWFYCKDSYNFVKKNMPEVNAFFAHTPMYHGKIVLPSDDSQSGRKISGNVIRNSISVADFVNEHHSSSAEMARGKIVYFAAYHDKFYNDFSVSPGIEKRTSDVIEEFTKDHPGNTRWDFMEFLNSKGAVSFNEHDSTNATFFSWYYSYMKQKEERLSVIGRMREWYGDRFLLVGPGWNEAGISSLPTNSIEPIAAYSEAAACLDIGSQFLDSRLYQRVYEIILSGGILLHKLESNSREIFRQFCDDISFNGIESMRLKAEAMMTEDRKAQAADMGTMICRDFLDPAECARTLLESVTAPTVDG